MINNLVIKGMYRIDLDKKGNISGTETKYNEVPAVIYDFEVRDEAVQYIKDVGKVFSNSIHIVKLRIDSKIHEKFSLIHEAGVDLVKFVLVPVDDTLRISNEHLDLLFTLKDNIDRVIIEDNSNSLFYFDLDRIINSLVSIGISEKRIGVCSKALSNEENCCLSALVLRELAAEKEVDCVLPTKRMQTSCGCLRWIEINEHIIYGGVREDKEKRDSISTKKVVVSFSKFKESLVKRRD